MRPGIGSLSVAPTGAAGGSFLRWSSPLPYLFGGLAAAMGLIAVALIILVCCNRKSSSVVAGRRGTAAEEKPSPPPLDAEPRVLVIMAGDAVPSFLAKVIPLKNPAPPI
ncbi:unnamed protein product [Spirodela intermedia]|uniref:Uncharacterized protein n=1 Tax=Spirodela intermedia TaxID=51605 RepID=A0A7I8LCK9_SPIIN|nr:unnamed protein product [Spirodela intermedia]